MPTIDRSAGNGDLIGDPHRGALAAKGGIGAATTRERTRGFAELPFDADHKLMATFHRATDDEHVFGAGYLACGHCAPATP